MTGASRFYSMGVFVKSVLARGSPGYLMGPTDIVLSKKNPGFLLVEPFAFASSTTLVSVLLV